MQKAMGSAAKTLQSAVARDGFTFVHAPEMRESLESFGALGDWSSFSESWNDLALDTYMADGGRYRRRRHAVYTVKADGGVASTPHPPHFQTLDYSPLHVGVALCFQPIAEPSGSGPTLQTILSFCHAVFGALAPATRTWRVEVHQFRIEARAGEYGRPTPEGLHRDGVDYVLVLLVNRRNIASGTTSIHAVDGSPLGSFTLTQPLDA